MGTDADGPAHARLEAILRASPDAIVTIDDDGCVLEWNPAAERMFGHARAEVLGKEMAELIVPPALRAAHRNGLARREGNFLGRRVELRAVRANGTEFPVEVTILRVPVEGPPIFTGFIRDLGEREDLLAREHATRVQAEKERAEFARLDQLTDQFLATVSHELRTPLQSILGWADLLASKPADRRRVEKAAAVIAKNATAQAKLVGDMLDVSRIITGKLKLRKEPVPVGALIDRSANALRAGAEAKNITLTIDIPEDVGNVVGDATRLEQVFSNLLANALKFTPADGHIEVRTRRDGRAVVVAVTDDGEGIAPDFLPFIFERFRQGDARPTRKHGGLGLGLAIVQHLVRLHGGAIRAESAGPGRGTTFTVLLVGAPPGEAGRGAEPSVPVPSSVPLPLPRPIPLADARLLVVDDHAESLELLDVALSQAGAKVVTATSARAALEALEQAVFDLVLSDIGMPEEDGYALLAKWLATPAAAVHPTPFVAFTAFASITDRQKALDAGFVDHVAKPVRPDEIVARVAELLGRPRPC